jgi:predicted MFS family arabinose efflux permease
MILRLHRAIPVTAVTFLCLLVAAGLRSAPSVMMMPLQLHFGWDRATVSLTSAVGIFLYGLVGPFAAALMLSLGIRRTMLGGLALMALGTLLSRFMTESWHYLLTWGVISGLGSGAIANVLGATITNRWFAKRQGLVMGLLSASTATGALIFLPFLAWLTRAGEWQGVVTVVGIACLVMIPLVFFLIPESPEAARTTRFGEDPQAPSPAARRGQPDAGAHRAGQGDARPHLLAALRDLLRLWRHHQWPRRHASHRLLRRPWHRARRRRRIALHHGHLRPLRHHRLGLADRPFRSAPVAVCLLRPARPLADRPALPLLRPHRIGRLRGLLRARLDRHRAPTVAIANRSFGEREAPIVFGWVVAGHQLGAACAALGAGLVRQEYGSYGPAFAAAGVLGVAAALAALALPATRAQLRPA